MSHIKASLFPSILYIIHLIVAHIGRVITLRRQEDGIFHCPCGEYGNRTPEQIRTHLKSSCRSNTDSILTDFLESFNNDLDDGASNSLAQVPQDLGERYPSDEENRCLSPQDDGSFLNAPDDAYMPFSGVRTHSCEENTDDGNGK
jgi:hypothetical protein